MTQLVVALTGGIASGKTQVSNKMAELGATIIDADLVARDVVMKDSPGWQAIYQRFGSKVLQDNGEIDRRELRKIVFNDAGALSDLNNITHPLISSSIHSAIIKNSDELVIVVIPLLTEDNRHTTFDRVLVVDVCEETQHQRLQKRDQINVQLAKQMMVSQLSSQLRLHLADDVISNQSTLQNLYDSVGLMYQFYVSLVR
ncbi:MAG: dephospho-CoA kinase [Proteobacteria bacterium]|nr:dephospho-CoA kinase [Pseudomonadota bacterium]